MIIKCQECGKEISDRATACPYCGCPIEASADANVTQVDESIVEDDEPDVSKPQKKKVNVKLIAGAIAGIIAVAVIAIAVYYNLTQNQRDYEKAAQAYSGGKYEEAAAAFEDLGDYKDSVIMLDKCKYELTTDRKFIRAFKEGIEARWKKLDEEPSLTNKEYSEVELSCIGEFKDAQFEDGTLGEKASEYIDALNMSVESFIYRQADSSKFNRMTEDAYETRVCIIADLYNDYGLTIEQEYTDTINEMLNTATGYRQTQAMRQELRDMLEDPKSTILSLTLTYDLNNHKTYDTKVVVTNTTDKTIDSLSFVYKMIDSNGIKTSTEIHFFGDTIGPGERASYDSIVSDIDENCTWEIDWANVSIHVDGSYIDGLT